MIICMRTNASTPRGFRSDYTTDDRVGIGPQGDLLNCAIAHSTFKASGPPTRSLISFDNEERDSWRKGGGAIHECFENFRLGRVRADLFNGRLNNGHIA